MSSEPLHFHFHVEGDDFTSAGAASVKVKSILRQIGFPQDVIRRVSVAMYEGEINMVIHAHGGEAELIVTEDQITVLLTDRGPGIPDISLAMREGYSTASENIREMGFGAGMGLPNMKRYSDDLQIQSELGVGTRIELSYYLSK
jgi:anti-sigma regulatory factor (Ser/Thr protein kinase)